MVELYDIGLELAEIDENIVREDLTVLQRIEQLERRKWIYEQKHPETAHGKVSPNKDAESAPFPAQPSFVDDTANKTNIAARIVQHDVAISKGIPKPLHDKLRGTKMENSKEDLAALARAKHEPQHRKKPLMLTWLGSSKTSEPPSSRNPNRCLWQQSRHRRAHGRTAASRVKFAGSQCRSKARWLTRLSGIVRGDLL